MPANPPLQLCGVGIRGGSPLGHAPALPRRASAGVAAVATANPPPGPPDCLAPGPDAGLADRPGITSRAVVSWRWPPAAASRCRPPQWWGGSRGTGRPLLQSHPLLQSRADALARRWWGSLCGGRPTRVHPRSPVSLSPVVAATRDTHLPPLFPDQPRSFYRHFPRSAPKRTVDCLVPRLRVPPCRASGGCASVLGHGRFPSAAALPPSIP